MSNAQDRAFAQLAVERAFLPGPVVAQAARRRQPGIPLAQQLVTEGLLPPRAASELLRELTRVGFLCTRCNAVCGYEVLAAHLDLRCPRCGGPLQRTDRRPPSSGTWAAVGATVAGSVTAPAPELDKTAPFEETLPSPELRRSERNVSSCLPSESEGSGGTDPSLLLSDSWEEEWPEQTLGPYTLLEELGRGAMGVVYLARRHGDEGRCALKVLLDGAFADEETVGRFRLESAVADKIEDPGVIPVFHVGRDGGHLYYAMEYCPGPTLKERIEEGRPLEPREAARLLGLLARTVEATHAAGVVHRDLKPSNVILDQRHEGRPRITDFGLARDRSLLRSMTQSGDQLGTPYYMAPEQFRGERSLDHRVDVYALGVILYQCLTGVRPYEGKTLVELSKKVAAGRAVPPRRIDPDLPAGLEQVALRAMDPRAEQRYPDAATLAEDLERCAQGLDPLRAGGPALSPLPLLVGAGAVILVGGAALFLSSLGGGDPPATPRPTPAASATPSGRQDALRLVERVRWRIEDEGPEASADLRAELRGELQEARRLAEGDADLIARIVAEQGRLELFATLGRLDARARARATWDELEPGLREAAELAAGQSELERRVALLRGALLVRRGRAAAALAPLDTAGEALGREGLEALRLRGLALERLGRRDEARQSYSRLAQADFAGARGLCAQAALARLGGRASEALDAAERAVQQEGGAGYAPALVERGLALLELDRFDGAELAFTDAQQQQPDDARADIGLGALRLREEKPESARRVLESARDLLEEDLDQRLARLLGLAYLALRRFEAADQVLEALLARDPRDLAGRVHRGALHHQRGDDEQAGVDWRAAHEQDPEVAQALLARWHPESVRERYGALVFRDMREAVRAVALGRLSQDTLDRLGARAARLEGLAQRDLLEALRRAAAGEPADEMAAALARAVRWAPEARVIALEEVRLLAGRDLCGEARAAIERARTLPSANKAVHLELDRLAAELLWREGQAGKALRALEELAGRDPDGVEGLTAASEARFLRGDYRGAVLQAERALRLSTRAPTLVARALGLIGLGRPQEALLVLNEAYLREGALDSRLLAGRVACLLLLERLEDAHEHPDEHFLRSPGGFCRRLAARLVLESSSRDEFILWAQEHLGYAAENESSGGELVLLVGLSALRGGEPPARVLELWQTARERDPLLPIPEHHAQLFRQRHGESEELADLMRR